MTTFIAYFLLMTGISIMSIGIYFILRYLFTSGIIDVFADILETIIDFSFWD